MARDIAEGFEGRAWWLELTRVSDPDLLPAALAQAVGAPEAPDLSLTEALVDHLKDRKTLLVLDNCEHLIEPCAELADALLEACPGLKMLATRREALRVTGETSFMVPSLSTPDPGHVASTVDLKDYEAVRLFVERSGEIDSGFTLTEGNATAVARLCDELDGIPLAIELAAARTRVLTAEQILRRLEDALGLLTTGSRTAEARHRTLRATLQWSHDLLSERELFCGISVFVGGFTLEAAEAVGQPGEALDPLSQLVEKSLVVGAEDEDATRYRMLEPVRQFGREKLEASGEASEILRRHAGHYLALAERAEPELMGPDQGLWLGRLRTELGNLRGTLSWSLEPGGGEDERAGLGLRLAAALWRFWEAEGLQEGKRWLREALEKDPGGFPAARAKALRGLGFILAFQRDYARADAALEEAVALYKELGDQSGAALALGTLGSVSMRGGFDERMPDIVQEGEALIDADLEGHARAFLRMVLGGAAMGEGDYDSAASQLEESLALSRELGDRRNISYSLILLSLTELKRGNVERGAALLEELVRIVLELKDRFNGIYALMGMGKMAALRGRPLRATRLWGRPKP